MKLTEMTLDRYTQVLKSDAPAPGGGSVSALAAAQGAALTAMVCDLTTGKEKYREYEDLCREAGEKATAIYEEAKKKIDEDTEAFNLVAAAFKMPKGSDEKKAARSKAIRKGTLKATEVPFSVMELSLEGLKNAESIMGRSNINAASDLGVAALNFKAAAQGAWLNVKINLPGLKDEETEKAFREKGEAILKEAMETADRIYGETEKSL